MKKFPLGMGAERQKKGKVFDEKIVGADWGQAFKNTPRNPEKHEKTGFKPVFLEQG